MPVGSRNPLKDQIAIVGIGVAPHGRSLNRTALSLGLEAARNAIHSVGSFYHDPAAVVLRAD